MARPMKDGVDYFPLDVNVDKKFRLVEAKFGIVGFGVIVKLFQLIYAENGYFLTPLQSIDESKRIMQGHKAELFVLQLSFIGWFILSSLTCGILLIYVAPYYSAAMTNFYNEIKDKLPKQEAQESYQAMENLNTLDEEKL